MVCFLRSLPPIVLLAWLFAFAGKVKAQEPLERLQLSAYPLDTLPDIDGVLAESVWQKVPVLDTFWMNFPESGVRSVMRTQIQVAYSATMLYIAASCTALSPYLVQSLKRDDPTFWEGDLFGVVVDPMDTKNSGYVFAVNPRAVQLDAIMGNQNISRRSRLPQVLNVAWNARWQSAVSSDSTKWTLEMAIPFKIIRHANPGSWGINFFRRDAKSNTHHTWSPVPVQFQEMNLDYTGRLVWAIPIEKTKFSAAVSPYALVQHDQVYQLSDQAAQVTPRVGADVRLGVSPGLNLDLTINPDFSQVDVDQQVTNLTTVNLRFPEQRLFFLENSDIFSNFGIPPMRPFFSRTIGLDQDGATVPILFGARLSGSLNNTLRVGLMTVQTNSTSEQPGANYTSVAFHQQLSPQLLFKGYGHNIQYLENDRLNAAQSNRNGGFQLDYRSTDGKYRGSWGYGASFAPGSSGENGFYKMELAYNGRNVNFFTNVAGVGNHYINDISFIPMIFHYDALNDTTYRHGFDHLYTRLNYIIYPRNKSVISHNIGIWNVYSITRDGQNFRYDWIPSYTVQWKNTSSLSLSYRFRRPQLLYPFAFTAEEPLPTATYRYHFGTLEYQSDRRKNLMFEAGLEYGEFYNGMRTQYSANVDYRVRPWGVFAVNLTLDNLRFPQPYGEERYLLVGNTIELSFSNSLFCTTFLQYNGQRNNFNINSRFQWQLNALSNLFLVYSENHTVEHWGRKDASLVVKFNYWFDI